MTSGADADSGDSSLKIEIEMKPGMLEQIETVRGVLETLGPLTELFGTAFGFASLLLAVAVAENQIDVPAKVSDSTLKDLRKIVAAAARRCGPDATALDLLIEIHSQ